MQPSLPNGTVLQNRYALIGLLGQGGFGRTYLAEDRSRFNERCALKEFIPPQAEAYALDKARELFQREAVILYQISHPQIPKFQATFEEDGRLFLVQDYVQGSTYRSLLNERLRQGSTFSEEEVHHLLRQLLPVLNYLHTLNIIHRDISPDNVILREGDRLPVLIDFGVVKELATRFQTVARGETTELQATAVGKTGYAPSEQIQTGRAYPSSDLYALAVTVIVLLTGREPQSLMDDHNLTWRWQTYAPHVSPTLAHVLNTMLSYQPAQRYPNAVAALAALQNVAIGSSTSAADPFSAAGSAADQDVATGSTPGVPVPVDSPSPSPPSPPSRAEVSTVKTVAIGRSAPPPTTPAPSPEPIYTGPPPVGSFWDNTWGVTLLGIALVVGAGAGSWALVNWFAGQVRNPSPTPTSASIAPASPDFSPTPPPTATPSPTPTATPTPSPSPSPRNYTERARVAGGQPFEARRSLLAGETATYRFRGRAGQLLQVGLEGTGITATILGSNGQPLDPNTDATSSWEGPLPTAGEYSVRIQVDPQKTEGNFRLYLRLSAAAAPTPTPQPTPSPTLRSPDAPSPDSPNPEPTPQASQSAKPEADTVGPDTPRAYRFSGDQGQKFRIVLDAPAAAKMTIFGPGGQPLPNLEGVSGTVTFDAPTTGNYEVEVQSSRPVPFKLQVVKS